MNKNIIIACLLTVLPATTWAGTDNDMESPSPLPASRSGQRFYYGGNFGLSFSGGTSILLQPMLGYHVTREFSIGMNLFYEFYDYSYKAHNLGLGPFARYEIPIARDAFGLLLHSELDVTWQHVKYDHENVWHENTMGRLPLGFGMYFVTSNRGRFSIAVLWDMFHLNQGYYGNNGAPTVRIGYTF